MGQLTLNDIEYIYKISQKVHDIVERTE